MLKIINASDWNQRADNLTGMLQYRSNQDFIDHPTIKKALQAATWATTYTAFAEVIVNEKTGEAVLVRDHFGCQPCYYYYDGHLLIFADKLPDLLPHLPHEPELNTSQLLALFTRTQIYSDETYYQKVYRVEPGNMLYVKPNHAPRKYYFWQLDPLADDLIYSSTEDYLAHFSALMHESVRFNTNTTEPLAGEMSGGLDSSSILVTAHQQNIHYPLFMHVADVDGVEVDDRLLAENLLRYLQLSDIHYINADQFDPISVFQFCAQQFAGMAPYIFFMLANNVHQAVVNHGCKILLSGACGDECVSGHAVLSCFLPDLLKRKAYRLAWFELAAHYQKNNRATPSFIFRALKLLQAAHPVAYRLLSKMGDCKKILQQYFQQVLVPKPFGNTYYPSVRAMEWDFLQGRRSHETRMRVEYSAVVAKAMGFEYRYPLLYPKLVEFCFRLPATMKRKNGEGRYLMRRYLEKYAPATTYAKQQKVGAIIPATLNKCKRYFKEGHFNLVFNNLPYLDWSTHKDPHSQLAAHIHAYMLHFIRKQIVP